MDRRSRLRKPEQEKGRASRIGRVILNDLDLVTLNASSISRTRMRSRSRSFVPRSAVAEPVQARSLSAPSDSLSAAATGSEPGGAPDRSLKTRRGGEDLEDSLDQVHDPVVLNPCPRVVAPLVRTIEVETPFRHLDGEGGVRATAPGRPDRPPLDHRVRPHDLELASPPPAALAWAASPARSASLPVTSSPRRATRPSSMQHSTAITRCDTCVRARHRSIFVL